MIYFKLKRYFSTQFSPRRLGILFFLDKKQNQKNQDWLMQPCNAAPTSHNPVIAMLFLGSLSKNAVECQINPKVLLQYLTYKRRIKNLDINLIRIELFALSVYFIK